MNDIAEKELERLATECRLYAKGKRPEFSLLMIADSLESLKKSLDERHLSLENPLSRRENEVLELLSLGYTNKEIARAFKLSEKTIEFHLGKIMQKTEASKRTEAVANAFKNGWLKGS